MGTRVVMLLLSRRVHENDAMLRRLVGWIRCRRDVKT